MRNAVSLDEFLLIPQQLGKADVSSRRIVITRCKPKSRYWTDEELLALPKDGFKYELLDGEIVMSPAGYDHGSMIMRLSAAIANYVYEHDLGEAYDGQTGFQLDKENLLCPDISFVTKERVAALPPPPKDPKKKKKPFFPGAPDLAVEVLSPGETTDRVNRKLAHYFRHGCKVAWVIDPASKTAMIYYGPDVDRMLKRTESLPGEKLLPGFDFPLSKIFGR